MVTTMPRALLLAQLPLDLPPAPGAGTTRAVWLADLRPERVTSGSVERYVFVPDSRANEVDEYVLGEAAGLPGFLRVGVFGRGETDEGLDVVVLIVFPGATCLSIYGGFARRLSRNTGKHGNCSHSSAWACNGSSLAVKYLQATTW